MILVDLIRIIKPRRGASGLFHWIGPGTLVTLHPRTPETRPDPPHRPQPPQNTPPPRDHRNVPATHSPPVFTSIASKTQQPCPALCTDETTPKSIQGFADYPVRLRVN